MNRWFVVAPASVALGWLLNYLHVPAAWILGAILCSGAMALGTGRDLKVNTHFYALCRGIIGVLAAVPLIGIPAGVLVRFLLPGLVVAAVTIGLGFLAGYLLSRFGKVSRETGILSMLAGGASMMPVIAQELGADMRYVALTQYLRLLTVSITLPLVTSLMQTPADTPPVAETPPWWMWLLVLAIAAGAGPLAEKAHIPVPSVFGPLLATILIGALTPVAVTVPAALAVVAFLSIGWVCGGGLSVPSLKHFGSLLPLTVGCILAMMAMCAGLGGVIAWWLDVSFFEGYLATSPGAIETVLALSAEGGAGPAVITLQLIRLIAIMLVAAYLPQIVRRATGD
ncbi:AbrB family transcriptional regulator [Corynebacterium auris]|uniref:AbrB family transcriptional regulator n=1 Tax=Corynebacterium auris TaxID=44750 RepID=UPI0025B5069C|nr:AbrB family transcriptional regulator [Corynebacterium auris]WJY67044.1 Putative ammonia monooxygenase [Corynebacterium auris]